VTLFPYFLLCSKSKIEEKKKKRNINNDLAILPSYNNNRERQENILEGNGDEDMSSVGIWEALGQKGDDGILKVVIVSLLYFIS